MLLYQKRVISLLWGTLVLSCKTFETFYYLATFMFFKIKLTSHIEVIYVLIIYLLKIQIFFFPDMNMCMWPLSHPLYAPLYHTPFWNTSVFFMQITSRFFRFNAYNTNVINGDKIIRFHVLFFSKTNE